MALILFNAKARKAEKARAAALVRINYYVAMKNWEGIYVELCLDDQGKLTHSPLPVAAAIAEQAAWKMLPQLIRNTQDRDLDGVIACVMHGAQKRTVSDADRLVDWETMYDTLAEPLLQDAQPFLAARKIMVNHAAKLAGHSGHENGISWARAKPEYDARQWGPLLALAKEDGREALAATLIRGGADIAAAIAFANGRSPYLNVAPEAAARLEAWQAAYAPKRPANKLVL